MRDFFKGWKRKIGVLTLVPTLFILGGWIESIFRYREICCHRGRHYMFVVESRAGGILWYCFKDGTADLRVDFSEPHSPARNLVRGVVEIDDVSRFGYGDDIWRWKAIGFARGECHLANIDITFVSTPYWSMVFPLALLSAYLLLSKQSSLEASNERP